MHVEGYELFVNLKIRLPVFLNESNQPDFLHQLLLAHSPDLVVVSFFQCALYFITCSYFLVILLVEVLNQSTHTHYVR